jgi:hypothetical protein
MHRMAASLRRRSTCVFFLEGMPKVLVHTYTGDFILSEFRIIINTVVYILLRKRPD